MFKIRNKTRGVKQKVWFKTPHFKKSGPHACLSDLFAWSRNFCQRCFGYFYQHKKKFIKKKNPKEYGEEKHILFTQTRLPTQELPDQLLVKSYKAQINTVTGGR